MSNSLAFSISKRAERPIREMLNIPMQNVKCVKFFGKFLKSILDDCHKGVLIEYS